jgi:hypothetical protein
MIVYSGQVCGAQWMSFTASHYRWLFAAESGDAPHEALDFILDCASLVVKAHNDT